MINQILDRLRMVDGATVREGFYAQGVAKEEKFIFLQPFVSQLGARNGLDKYRDDLMLQVIAGINVSRTTTPTNDLLTLVKQVRSAFFQGERNTEKPAWLSDVISFKEAEPCKYIMPENHEKHGLAVITLSIVHTNQFGDS